MIILNTVNKNVSLITTANVLGSLAIKAGWTDDTATPAVSVTPASVSSTEATIVPSPGTGVTRAVKLLEVTNNSLTLPAMLTINKNVSGSPTLLYKTELFPGETLKFSSRRGWYKLDNTGVMLELTTEPDYDEFIDDVSTPGVVYNVRGLPGSDSSEPVWAASSFNLTTGRRIWSGRTNQMKFIADNRATLTYP